MILNTETSMKELYWINGCEETELMLAGSVNDAKNDALALRSGISGTNSSRRDTASQIEKISSLIHSFSWT